MKYKLCVFLQLKEQIPKRQIPQPKLLKWVGNISGACKITDEYATVDAIFAII